MSLASGAYVGHVRHRRRAPRHAFKFPLFMVYLDLEEIPLVFAMSRWWGLARWCPARFVREDYLQRHGLDLAESVRSCVREQTGQEVRGPIRMLTHLRYFGYTFNPVSFYYCFDPTGEHVEFIVAEITNTPWKQRHAYVLAAASADRTIRGATRPTVMRWRFGKRFHVSPFMPMEMEYDWAFATPGATLLAHMNLRDDAGRGGRGSPRAFDATLAMSRRELSPNTMRWLLLAYPFMTARVVFKIHLEAAKLWLKRAVVYPNPSSGGRAVPDDRTSGVSTK